MKSPCGHYQQGEGCTLSMGILTLVSSSMVVQRVKIQWGWSHLLWIHDACPCTVNQPMRLLHKFKRSRKEKVQLSHALDDCVWTLDTCCLSRLPTSPRLPHGAVPTEFFRKEEIKRPTWGIKGGGVESTTCDVTAAQRSFSPGLKGPLVPGYEPGLRFRD
jgi:hypothetical protein